MGIIISSRARIDTMIMCKDFHVFLLLVVAATSAEYVIPKSIIRPPHGFPKCFPKSKDMRWHFSRSGDGDVWYTQLKDTTRDFSEALKACKALRNGGTFPTNLAAVL